MKEKFIITSFILTIILNFSFNKKCGEEEIENCNKCGNGTCIECDPKHFLFFNNLLCLPCDHEYYGQKGCGGNCDGSKFKDMRIALCEEDGCKKGFYYIDGRCHDCSKEKVGCSDCSIDDDNKKIICKECISKEFKLNKDFNLCDQCSMNNCLKCHFNEDYTSTLCDECKEGYYVDSTNACSKCKNVDIPNGNCKICSDNEQDINSKTYSCNQYYVLVGTNCIKCPDNCPYCEYNEVKKETECTRCKENYIINSNRKCTYCGENCDFCKLNEKSEPICLFCNSNYFLSEGKCLNCPDNCQKCKIAENNEIKCVECNKKYALLNGQCIGCKIGCTSCDYNKVYDRIDCKECTYNYALDKDNQCVPCSSKTEIGGQACEECGYNELSTKFECYNCKGYDSYAYIYNEYKCLSNSDSNQADLYGCLKANYNEKENKYECTECKLDYIPITNEHICRYPSEIGLNDNCLQAEKIELESGSKYSCSLCKIPYKKTKKLNNITDCLFSYNLDYCSSGEKDLNDATICTECVKNAYFNKKKNLCQCNNDSFSKDEDFCYKCDNEIHGMPGCDATQGCQYNDVNGLLSCNKCKSGYALYREGQCFSCSEKISNCNKCHFNKTVDKLICDSCTDNYIINTEKNICELNNCSEYSSIAQGCIICDDKINEYIPKKKCQSCKPGYFKTKDDSCVYCSSEKYGGTGCYECTYDLDKNGQETENIICKNCSGIYQALSSDGKCYNCQADLNYGCQKCEFIKINEEENTEKLVCTQCYYQYYLNSEGICINYLPQLKKIPYCREYEYKIGNNIFKYFNNEDEFLYSSTYNINITKVDDQINTECKKCENGYYLNDYGNCIILTIEDCSLVSIIQNFPQRYTECKTFCDQKSYCYIDYVIKNNGNENNNGLIKVNMSEIFEKNKSKKNLFSLLDDNIKSIIIGNNLCLSNSGKGSNEELNILRKCFRSEYNVVNDSYICTKCINGYYLDYKTKTCKQNIENEVNYNCEIDNIGNSSNPKYSCKKCYNENDILVTIEDGAKLCLEAKGELENCKEATADTTYVKNLYNCTSCSDNYIPYYSKFYGRMICQNIYGEIEEKKNISLENFMYEDSKDEKECLKNCFTPDGNNYYDCNSEFFGMKGCEGPCEFSLKKNNTIECKGICQSKNNDIFEISKGICGECNIVNKGCFKCHYEDEYPNDYFGIKRKKRFVCDECEPKYIMSKFNKCLFCSDLLPKCEECENDKENNGEIKCTKCSEGFYLDDNGYCIECKENRFQGNKGKCINCDNTNEGGILGCSLCKITNNKVICKLCKLGYILIKNMNICIPMSSNNELKKFGFCEQLTLDNDKYYCSKCKFQFSLINEDNQNKCKYVPTLFDYFYPYYNDKELILKKMLPLRFYEHFSFEKYLQHFIYDENEYLYYPCEEATNSGTIDNPIYSCTKCYTFLENKENNNIFTKIIDEKNNIKFCIYRNYLHQMANCEEAKNIIKNGKKEYECIKCIDEDIFYINNDGYCEYYDQNMPCMVDKCSKCEFNNNYFCEFCLNSDYEVNKYSGSCVKKTELIPAITWKDIFRLELNSVKKINNKEIYGPSLHLRGLTNYQINSYHAFLIYLEFKLKYSKNNRNLQEEIKIPAICQIERSVAEVNDSVNIIDYDCIGNTNDTENLEEYELNKIEEGNNTGLLKKSNLEEIISNENLSELIYKNDSNFTDEDLNKIIVFEMDEIKNITLKNYDSEFKINGKINKEINQTVMEAELNIIEINNLSASCIIIIEERNKLSLNCTISIKPYKNQKTFSFKTSEIITAENDIYLSKINEIFLINEVKEEKIDENKNEKIIIQIIIIIIVVFIVILGIYFWIKKCKRDEIEKEKNKNNERQFAKNQDKSISKTIRSLYEK